MPPKTTMPFDANEVMEAREDMPTKARDVYSYGCILMQVRQVFPFNATLLISCRFFLDINPITVSRLPPSCQLY